MSEQLLLLVATLIPVALVSYPADLLRRRSPSRAGAAQVATAAVLILAVAGASAAGVAHGATGVVALVAGILLGSAPRA